MNPGSAIERTNQKVTKPNENENWEVSYSVFSRQAKEGTPRHQRISVPISNDGSYPKLSLNPSINSSGMPGNGISVMVVGIPETGLPGQRISNTPLVSRPGSGVSIRTHESVDNGNQQNHHLAGSPRVPQSRFVR